MSAGRLYLDRLHDLLAPLSDDAWISEQRIASAKIYALAAIAEALAALAMEKSAKT